VYFWRGVSRCLETVHFVLRPLCSAMLPASAVGAYLPIYPIEGCVVSVPMQPGAKPPHACIVYDAKKVYIAPLHGGVRMSGFADIRGEGKPPTLDTARAKALLANVSW
jgi:glycine/D-amino acid oxidase-like deaminating enzyme